MRILIVDDSQGIRSSLGELLKKKHEVVLCEDGDLALAAIEEKMVDLVITDHQMPRVSGLEVIQKGKALSPMTSFVLLTAYASIDQAIEAIRIGADDYFTKPFDLAEIMHRIERIEQLRIWNVEKALRVTGAQDEIVGDSATAKAIRAFVTTGANSHSSVLIQGPLGAGKRFIAEKLHKGGTFATRPYLVMPCRNRTAEALLADLFGDEAGKTALDRAGKLALAMGGTLVLDEVAALPEAVQTKLSAALQEKEYTRMGSKRRVKQDTRVVGCTESDRDTLVKNLNLREDLLRVLGVSSIQLPALSQRLEDIKPLAQYFWKQICDRQGRILALPDKTLEALQKHTYQGNIRELRVLLEYLALRSEGDKVPTELPKL